MKIERCRTEGSTNEGNFGGKLWGRAFGGDRELTLRMWTDSVVSLYSMKAN